MENKPFHTDAALWEKLKPLARQMRHEPTLAEHVLWQQIRNRRVMGAKFRRQYTVERFIVDFICLEARLIIEVDGASHDYTQDEDAVRQVFLEAQGFQVIRFHNEQVLTEIEGVLAVIAETLANLTLRQVDLTPRPPLQSGEGEPPNKSPVRGKEGELPDANKSPLRGGEGI